MALLSKESRGCRWCMCIGFLYLARSSIANCLLVFIDLARLSTVPITPRFFTQAIFISANDERILNGKKIRKLAQQRQKISNLDSNIKR